MKHLNSHQLCVVALRTTGKDFVIHEMRELCVIPVSPNLTPEKEYLPFNVVFRPRNKENYTPRVCSKEDYLFAQKNGLDSDILMTGFEEWYDRLRLLPKKRIIPITYNWHNQYPFLMNWFGWSDNKYPDLHDFVHPSIYRDILPVAQYWADLAYFNQEHVPFPKMGLHSLAFRLGVKRPMTNSLLSYCLYLLDVYKQLTGLRLPTGVDLPLRYPIEIDYFPEKEDGDDDDGEL